MACEIKGTCLRSISWASRIDNANLIIRHPSKLSQIPTIAAYSRPYLDTNALTVVLFNVLPLKPDKGEID